MANAVTSVAAVKCFACSNAFWPVEPSRTSNTSCGASGITFWITLLIFESSSIKWALLCKRPAVSINTISVFFDTALWTVSKATAAGSDPIGCFTIGTSALSLQIVNWSTAAARNVSAAPNKTLLPACLKLCASFPIVVVLPTPLTPTTRII